MASPYLIFNQLTDSIKNYEETKDKLTILKDILRDDSICYKVADSTNDEYNVKISFNNDIPMEFILKLSENDIKFKVDKIIRYNYPDKQVVII